MKIGVIASTYPRFPGDGASRFVQSLSEALVCLEHQVHVLAPQHPQAVPMTYPVNVQRFRYIWPDSLAIMGYANAMESDQALRKLTYFLAGPFFLSGLLHFSQMAKKHQFDAIHAHWVIPNGPIAALVARRFHLPLLISLHGSDIFVARKNPVLRRIARWTFSQAGAITACSPDLAEGALDIGATPDQVHLIPWGAEPDQFQNPQGVEALRQRWNLPKHKQVILSLGRLVKKKGVEYLVRAAPLILETCPNTQIVIVGNGPERTSLQKLAAELKVADDILFIGELHWKEVPAALQLCDIFTVPSIHDENGNVDGLPTTILEAMASGKPVVGSNVAGIPLVVTSEQTGLLVAEANAFELAHALIDLLQSEPKRIRLGQEGQLRVVQEFNWIEVAKKFERLFLPS